MLVETAIEQQSIQMVFCQAPNAGEEAKRIWDKGMTSWGVDVMTEGVPRLPLVEDVDLATATRYSFGFVVMWGRKGGDSNVVACLSNNLLGFTGNDPIRQRLCGLDILQRITDAEGSVFNYGAHKYVAYLETDVDEGTMLRRLVDSQSEPIGRYFPAFGNAQQELAELRRQELIDLEEGSEQPFVDIFQGEVSALRRAFQADSNRYFQWGYEEEEGEFFGINLDNNKQALSELIKGATVSETAAMLQDIANFLKGHIGKNRFVFQLDFGADAACCNVAFNAQQNILMSGVDIPSLVIGGFDFQNSSLIRYLPPDIYRSNNNCKKCQKNKNDGCSCKDENKSDRLN